MSWLDQSLRDKFESGKTLRQQSAPTGAKISSQLDQLLPDTMVEQSLAIGNELILGYEHALRAIEIANQQAIAVLGFDAGEIVDDGFQVLDYSGYDAGIHFNGDWDSYVSLNNIEARRWLETHPLGRNHGYILTSASQKELSEARESVGRR